MTIGGALSNAFGGPIATNLTGENLHGWFVGWGWTFLANITDWSAIDGWRIAFVVIGAPGVLLGLLVLLTVKEPPRGYSDAPGTPAPEKASIVEAMRELARKPTFWTMAMGAELMPRLPQIMNPISEMKAPIMNTSPCAKLIMPMMP